MQKPPRRILLAEDDRFFRKAAEAVLRRQGYAVLTASDGEEALRMARTEAPDLILLDLILPKLQGFEALRELTLDPATSRIPVIVLSSLEQENDVQAAKQAGARDYFVKSSLPLPEMVRRVQSVLGEAAG